MGVECHIGVLVGTVAVVDRILFSIVTIHCFHILRRILSLGTNVIITSATFLQPQGILCTFTMSLYTNTSFLAIL